MLSEREIEQQILGWLNLQKGCKAWKNKSMGVYDPTKGVYRKDRSKFSEKGSSDILGIWNQKMLCIEVKSAKGRVSPEQQQFLQQMANLGAICLIARSLQDVVIVFDTLSGKDRNDQSALC
jgi:hypothetical protein